MGRFFLENKPENNFVTLSGTEAHHLLHVKRAREGMSITLFDKEGMEYSAKIISCGRKDIQLEIVSQNKKIQECLVEFCLGQSLIKRKSWDIILQKSMELGTSELAPIISKYTCEKKIAGNEQRWNKILISAAKQCHRNDFVKISPTQTFSEFVEQHQNTDLCLLAHNNSQSQNLKTILDQSPIPKKIVALVGPEGGFSDQEVALAKKNNFIPVSLGNYILRAETAAIAMMSNISFFYKR